MGCAVILKLIFGNNVSSMVLAEDAVVLIGCAVGLTEDALGLTGNAVVLPGDYGVLIVLSEAF